VPILFPDPLDPTDPKVIGALYWLFEMPLTYTDRVVFRSRRGEDPVVWVNSQRYVIVEGIGDSIQGLTPG
jgi:hypothetical protein